MKEPYSLDDADLLALDLTDLDVDGIQAISGGDEIASLTSGHAVADLAASCTCSTSSTCPAVDASFYRKAAIAPRQA
jgi:hypothetical protein